MKYIVETLITHTVDAESPDEAKEKARDMTRTSGHDSAEIIAHQKSDAMECG